MQLSWIRDSRHFGRRLGPIGLAALVVVLALTCTAPAAELSVDDFFFDGPLGSDGATIEKVGTNHFKITLGHAPEHPDWCNMLYFNIARNARGNSIRLDVCFNGGDTYRFNHNSCTWSYDANAWQAIQWQKNSKDSAAGDTLLFPEFAEDTVYFGAQVPLSYETLVELMGKWAKHPHARVEVLGKSLGGRDICRLEITDLESPVPKKARWGHYFANQHPGEHNSQWRMAGMIDWLLSDHGADCRRRSVSHFILMSSPDGPSRGWYRVNAQGVDMNRSYFAAGSNEGQQAHEAFIIQRDLEKLMASQTPLTDVWSMHTWSDVVEPIMLCGPEMGSVLPTWERLKDILLAHDPKGLLVEPLKTREKAASPNNWSDGPHVQFGITTVLCEGAGNWTSKQDCLDAGAVLMKSIAEYYAGTKP